MSLRGSNGKQSLFLCYIHHYYKNVYVAFFRVQFSTSNLIIWYLKMSEYCEHLSENMVWVNLD